ncbi:MAG: hypothetical protein JW731_12075 [Bacteroidales bacterium]|nr:hypothetical protein [Bacteroidales bacterium]
MKIKNIILTFFIIVACFYNCKKDENAQPNIEVSAGTRIYQQDENTFYTFISDTLFKCTPAEKVKINYSITGSTLTSNGLTINNMFSDNLFPIQNNEITLLSGDVVYFRFDGIADGVVLFQGDTTARGESHIYADYPFAKGESFNISADDEMGTVTYKYSLPGNWNAVIVARNFWRTEEYPKEQILNIGIQVLDSKIYNYIY